MNQPVNKWTEDDLLNLIGTAESTILEFKAHGAFSKKNSDWKKELCKDVSAMANAAGGLIIYGIAESGTDVAIADRIEGCDRQAINKDTIEQILSGGIEPRLHGVNIHTINLADGTVAFLVEIPQTKTFAPHQSRGHAQYFRRYNSQILPMQDHEVRDVMRRASTPELVLYIEDFTSTEFDDKFGLIIKYGNLSQEPALYSSITLILDQSLDVDENGLKYFEGSSSDLVWQGAAHKAIKFHRNFTVPQHMPIYRERSYSIVRRAITIKPNSVNHFMYHLTCPGFTAFKTGRFVRLGSNSPMVEYD